MSLLRGVLCTVAWHLFSMTHWRVVFKTVDCIQLVFGMQGCPQSSVKRNSASLQKRIYLFGYVI